MPEFKTPAEYVQEYKNLESGEQTNEKITRQQEIRAQLKSIFPAELRRILALPE